MADNLDDGEFWLPSHFLTDDDIIMDLELHSNLSFNDSATTNTRGGGSSSSIVSDFDFNSVESDEDQISLHLSSCPLHFKGCGGILSSSPQSTLCRCMCNQSSSRESLSPPPQPPQAVATTVADVDNTTLSLLNKAAGEVARLKLKSESNNKKVGTGFFDCSQNRVSTYPMKNQPLHFQPQFLHFPPVVWTPSNVMQYKYNQPKPQPQQNRATKSEIKTTTNTANTNNNNKNNNNRPLGLPPSAWPPLQAQAQAHPKSQAQQQPPQPQPQPQPLQLGPIFSGPPKGTGVFLPRRVNTTTPANETRKKSDGNGTKTKSGKGSQPQSNHHRRNADNKTTKNNNEIQLPQEWIY